MRTTLDIEDDVLGIAKDLARADGRSVGKVISDLAREGLDASAEARTPGFQERAQVYNVSDFPTFPTGPGGPVTSALIERIEDELDREDAMAWDHETDSPRV